MSALAAMSLSQTAIAAVDDADVDNPAGTTITGTGYGVKLDAGGPYTIDNAGEISAEQNTLSYGILVLPPITVTSINNTPTGVIKGNAIGGGADGGRGIFASGGSIGTLINAGLISGIAGGDDGIGIKLISNNIETVTNSGTITGSAGGSDGYGLFASKSTITTLTNTGTISGSVETDTMGVGLRLKTASIITLTNNGLITASAGENNAFGIYMDKSSINTLTNAGTISGLATDGDDAESGAGIYLEESTITTLNNSGLSGLYIRWLCFRILGRHSCK